jgi:hypothetical protein
VSPQILGIDDYPEPVQFYWSKPLFWPQSVGDFLKTTVFLFLSLDEHDAKEKHC